MNPSTRGVDLVATWGAGLGAGALTLSAAANLTGTSVDEINIPELTAAFREANGRTSGDAEPEVIRNTLFNREERNRFEGALPRTKIGLSARYDLGSLSLLTGATWYGPVEYKPANTDHDETFDGRTIIDLDVGRDLLPGVRLAVGANNLLNTFPEEHEKQANIGSRGFVYSRRVTRFGVNGGFYYGRLSFDL